LNKVKSFNFGKLKSSELYAKNADDVKAPTPYNIYCESVFVPTAQRQLLAQTTHLRRNAVPPRFLRTPRETDTVYLKPSRHHFYTGTVGRGLQ
jgi:hypothetical protein